MSAQKNMWVGKLTMLDMTLMGLLGHETSIQTQYSASKDQRIKSDCMDVQADLDLHCLHMLYNTLFIA